MTILTLTTKTEAAAKLEPLTLPFGEATAALDAAQSILIVTHVAPDGDAIGSLLGLGLALQERYPGKSIDLVVDGGVPEFLRFVPAVDTVLPELNQGSWDVMVSVDSSDEPRTGKAGVYGRTHSPLIINLDHHASNTGFGQIHLVNAQAVSATEVVYDWLQSIQHPISRPVAIALLTGLTTDTLGYRTSNVKPRTLEIAQHLMQAGASLTEITQRALESMELATLNLWKQVFPSIRLEDGIGVAVITPDDLRLAGADETTDVGLANFLLKVNEVMISAVFKGLASGKVELSFRSKPGFDVSKVAVTLGGGGHKQASGATIDGPLDVAQARVLTLLKAAIHSGQLSIG
jgi:phosphoesterase RecJ-like protein